MRLTGGVAIQGLTAVVGFRKHGKLDTSDTVPILIPSVVGGLLGGGRGLRMPPPEWIKPLLLGTMLAMAFIILVKPSIVAPEPGGTLSRKVMETPSSWWGG